MAGASSGPNTRETAKSFLSTVNQDWQLNAGSTVDNYAGDYNTLAADIMDSTSGFRGGYGSNYKWRAERSG
jgi:hypothetical protein